MRPVRDESGKRYLLVKRSEESSRVRDPATGEERYVATDRLDVDDSAAPLSTAASGIPAPVRRAITAVHDERALGLLVTVVDRDAIDVRTLLSATDLCESDLHGLLAELRAAGLLAETRIAGERGYEATDDARTAVERLRDE